MTAAVGAMRHRGGPGPGSATRLVGRERELERSWRPWPRAATCCLRGRRDVQEHHAAGDHEEWGIPLVFVEGNADLTPAADRPPQPGPGAAQGYSAGQLRRRPAGQGHAPGGFLYIEEFNRAPEDTLNTLLTAMAERESPCRGWAG